MEHSRKYTLVPLDRMQEFEEEHLSELDSQIKVILKKKISDDEKVKLYNQILQKYVTFPSVNDLKPLEQETQEPENKWNPESKILEAVPTKLKDTARKIIEFLQQNNISWNSNNELLNNQKLIPGSDIVQLINFLLRKRKTRPQAFDQFQEMLSVNNFPQEFVKNTFLTKPKTMYAKPKRAVKRLSNSKKWLNM